MPATAAWLASVEALLNRSLEGSAQAAALCRQLCGTSLDIDVHGLMRVRVAAAEGRLALLAVDEGRPNAAISGSAPALLQLLKEGGSPPPAAASAGTGRAGAAISGDAEIANLYRRLLQLARPDAEEELSRWVGDFPARHAARLARGAIGFMRRLGGTARANVAEYLQEESRDLVNRTELEEFLRGVDAARETADRIDARLGRLEARIKGAL